jgi:aspartate racemase
MQETVIHPAIYDLDYGIKSGVSARAREDLLQGVAALQAQGAELIILGCTEIPLVLPEIKIGPTLLIDPTKILARALIREANPKKLRME